MTELKSAENQLTNRPIYVLSLGAGVQSSTLALMASNAEVFPSPDVAIFADTQSEPRSVYKWLDWLTPKLRFPVLRVTKGDLRANILGSVAGGRFAGAPFYTEASVSVPVYCEACGGEGCDECQWTGEVGREQRLRGGMLRRQCTREFKVEPITKKLRELVGLRPRQIAPRETLVVQYIGISADEALRMKPSRQHWIEHRWPLVERGMTRGHCLEWLKNKGYPTPSKSACTFCPYHDDRTWRDMKASDSEAWADAVRVDEAIRGGVRGTKERLFLHRSLKPLAEVDFRQAEDFGQQSFFTNECEGLCGV